MPRGRTILATLAMVLTLARGPATADAGGVPARPGWKLDWHDEFDGTELDATKWAVRYPGPRESSIISAESVSLDGRGHLVLAVKERKDGTLLNGMIGTQGRFRTTYGLIEARIKFPRMQGQHGSFWMQPDRPPKAVDNPALSGAEIDIIEWFGAGRKDGGTASNLYWPGPAGPKEHHAGGTRDFHGLLPAPQAEWSDDFHVYSVEWSAREYVFRIDGRETYRLREGVSQTPQYLILSLLTADWEKDRLDRSQLPSVMRVDWVRVWKKERPPGATGS